LGVVLPPPTPLAQPPTPIAISNSNTGKSTTRNLRGLRLRQPPIGIIRNAKNEPASARAALTLPAIVRVVVAAAVPLGVTVVGLKVQVELAGRPEQAKVVAAWNPLTGVTVTVIEPDAVLPLTVPLVGVRVSPKSAAGAAFTVIVSAAEVEVRLPLSPP
jgi:hypothetical protein